MCRQFAPLFQFSAADRSKISEFGIWTAADRWTWQMGFQDNNLSAAAAVMLAELSLILQPVQPSVNVSVRYERILGGGNRNWAVGVERANFE